VREFHQQEQLGEGVVFQRDALIQPLASDLEQLREQPGLYFAIKAMLGRAIFALFAVLTEILFESELGKQEGDFGRAAALEVVAFSVLVGMSAVERASLESLLNLYSMVSPSMS
jgi:hypothetical protein